MWPTATTRPCRNRSGRWWSAWLRSLRCAPSCWSGTAGSGSSTRSTPICAALARSGSRLVSPRDPARPPSATPGGPGSLLALQEAMARALIDPAHRGGVALPPPMAGVAPERLAAFARMLEGKRRRRVEEALPASCRLLGVGFVPLFAAYAAAHPPTEAVRREEIAAFASFAVEALRSPANVGPDVPGAALVD